MADVKLQPLRELPALEIDDDSPDVRGWNVEARDGRTAGRVDDLLANADSLQAAFLIVELRGDAVLVPVESVDFDRAARVVRAPHTFEEIRAMTPYRRDQWPRSS